MIGFVSADGMANGLGASKAFDWGLLLWIELAGAPGEVARIGAAATGAGAGSESGKSAFRSA